MNHLPTGLATSFAALMLLAGAFFVAVTPTAEAADGPGPIKFGMESASISAQSAAGVKPDYGTFWIGPWTLSSGWAGPDNQLASMKAAGVTPAIHFYYWGDDISPSCVENGCWSSLHNAQKTRAGWEQLGTQLTSHLNSKMGGAPVVIFLESEFNKGGIETYEPFDGYMAAMAGKIHAAYPNAIIVLGFGNWGSNYWGTFDRAAAASDMVGIQGMRGSTRQSKTDMMTLYDGLLAGVKTLNAKFPGEAIMLTDLAVSSYPEPEYLTVQRDVLKEVFDNRATLKSLGVQAMIYRSWKDSPNMDLANWYGMAERYWGLANANGVKPSAQVWIDGVKAERAGSAPAPSATSSSTSTSSGPYAATVSPSPNSNEWWIQVGVSPAPAKVEAKVGFGSFVALDKQSYGWAKSLHAPSGTMVQFRVTAPDGQTATTPAQAWLVDMSAKTATTGSASSSTTSSANRAPTAAFTATVSSLTAAVDASASSDPEGTPITYAWTFGDGATALGRTASHAYAAAGTYTVTLKVSDGSLSATATKSVTVAKPAAYAATFTTHPASNEWWVQEKAASSPAPAKVDVRVNGGAWQPMKLQSYGDWTVSTHIVKGSQVVFRATAPDGQTSLSAGQSWLGAATSTTSTAFKATFSPKAVGNDWWVETAVSGNAPIAKVEAKVNNGSYVTLSKSDWGTYAKSIHAPNGSLVTFRATSSSGATSTSGAVTWK